MLENKWWHVASAVVAKETQIFSSTLIFLAAASSLSLFTHFLPFLPKFASCFSGSHHLHAILSSYIKQENMFPVSGNLRNPLSGWMFILEKVLIEQISGSELWVFPSGICSVHSLAALICTFQAEFEKKVFFLLVGVPLVKNSVSHCKVQITTLALGQGALFICWYLFLVLHYLCERKMLTTNQKWSKLSEHQKRE